MLQFSDERPRLSKTRDCDRQTNSSVSSCSLIWEAIQHLSSEDKALTETIPDHPGSRFPLQPRSLGLRSRQCMKSVGLVQHWAQHIWRCKGTWHFPCWALERRTPPLCPGRSSSCSYMWGAQWGHSHVPAGQTLSQLPPWPARESLVRAHPCASALGCRDDTRSSLTTSIISWLRSIKSHQIQWVQLIVNHG